MTRSTSIASSHLMRLLGIFWLITAGILLWFASELHQMLLRQEEITLRQAVEMGHEIVPDIETRGMCPPLLPVRLWNKDPATVPDPPPWRRAVV